MNKMTLHAWPSVCSLFLLFTGCTGDDQPNNSTTRNTGTNANNQPPRCLQPAFPPSAMTLTPSDGTGPVRILLAASTYVLTSQANADPENGTYTYTPSGNMASLVLTPSTGDLTRNVNFVITTSTQGTYTSDSLGQGTFTLDSPLLDGCGPS